MNMIYSAIFSPLMSIFIILSVTNQAVAQFTPEEIDTLYHAQVAPGMYHTEYDIRPVPWRIQVLRINQNEQEVEFRTVKANNRLTGLETPTEMKSQLENDSVYVAAGINGDFFQGGGVPVNAQVVNGELLKQPYPRELIAFDEEFQPFIETTSFTGIVEVDDEDFSVTGINESRGENHLTVFNSFYGETTGTNEFGTEVGVRLVDQPVVNRPVDVVVESIETGEGDMQITPYDMVLSGHDDAAEFLETFEVDDTLAVTLRLTPLDMPLLEVMGGSTQFIKNGVVDSNWEERHPRTAVGFSADTSNIYFVVVDGRQSHSAGMMLSEMGDFMVEIGADHAINLDGGGSSAMVIQDDVVNKPSDGGLQRAVSNALFVTMENPGIGEVERIQIHPGYQKLFLGGKLNLTVHGYDENHRRDCISASEVDFSADDALGSVSSSGQFTAEFEAGKGYLYAETDDFRDSTYIEIVGVDRLTLTPEVVTVDTTMEFTPKVSLRDPDGLQQTLDGNRISWTLTNEMVGEVDEEGNFIALSPGTTGLIGAVGEAADTVWINVEQLDGFTELTQFSDPENWEISTENLDKERVSLQPFNEGGVELQFSYPSQPEQAHIFLNHTINIEGVPKFAHIETSGDGEDYIVFADIENPDDGRYRMSPQRIANHKEPETLEFIFEKNWATRMTSGASYYFPFSLENVSVQLPENNSGEDIEGVFRFHRATAVYSESAVNVEDPTRSERPEDIVLVQNYPNPFNPVTTISYQLPERSDVRLEVFDMLGRSVSVLVDEQVDSGHHEVTFDASNLASGLYLYRLQTASTSITKNMMLIK